VRWEVVCRESEEREREAKSQALSGCIQKYKNTEKEKSPNRTRRVVIIHIKKITTFYKNYTILYDTCTHGVELSSQTHTHAPNSQKNPNIAKNIVPPRRK